MSLLDVKNKVLGQTVVQHSSDLPGLFCERRIAYKTLEEPLYEERALEHCSTNRSHLLGLGYKLLVPVCDPEVIRNRQEVIRNFLTDFPDKKRYFPILNMMHLIDTWLSKTSDKEDSMGRPLFDAKRTAGALDRYLLEADRLHEEFSRAGGLLSKLAQEYSEKSPRKATEQVIEACRNGKFGCLIFVKDKGSYRVMGIAQNVTPKEGDFISLGQHDLYEQLGWTNQDFIRRGACSLSNVLGRIYAPLLALYFEAAYINKRREKGQRVCLPKINKEGVFEMVEGEPILETPEPVEWRSFRFDQKNSRALLNGLHSAGKTHLLMDIPLYVIRGLRGFSEPAYSAKIPIIKRIIHSINIRKLSQVGSLESELTRRAEEIMQARRGDLVLVDEFLMHASPDAADPLDPLILREYENTQATFIVVDHRGEGIDETKWQFWSPGFREDSEGKIFPTYKFEKGRPNLDILKKHAIQLIRKIAQGQGLEEQKKPRPYESLSLPEQEWQWQWLDKIERRILSGGYQ